MIDNNNTQMDSGAISGSSKVVNPVLDKPKPVDVSDFNSTLSGDSPRSADVSGNAPVASEAQDVGKSGEKLPEAQMMELLTMLLELIAMLNEENGVDDGEGKGGEKPAGGEPLGSGSGAPSGGGPESPSPGKVENNKVVAENNVAAGDGQIPKPTEHMQSFNLGDKQVTIGGDGSASKAEVQQTKDALTDMYENSPTFKEMIDNSPDEGFEVSVGRRADNMSWGNADGRVFMNVNNITPESSDNFQALTAHEFAHAGIDLGHGSEMQRFETVVSQEA